MAAGRYGDGCGHASPARDSRAGHRPPRCVRQGFACAAGDRPLQPMVRIVPRRRWPALAPLGGRHPGCLYRRLPACRLEVPRQCPAAGTAVVGGPPPGCATARERHHRPADHQLQLAARHGFRGAQRGDGRVSGAAPRTRAGRGAHRAVPAQGGRSAAARRRAHAQSPLGGRLRAGPDPRTFSRHGVRAPHRPVARRGRRSGRRRAVCRAQHAGVQRH